LDTVEPALNVKLPFYPNRKCFRKKSERKIKTYEFESFFWNKMFQSNKKTTENPILVVFLYKNKSV
jgi:hypothetical protein